MSQHSDEDLLMEAGQGDRASFGLLVERYHRPVMHYIHRFLGTITRETAEDLTQDVFLSAWKAARSFTPRAKVITWLFKIATNICLNHRRAAKLRRFLSLQMFEQIEPAAPVDEGSSTRDEAVRMAIAKLPDRQRAAIVLKHYHDFSYAQIADTLALSGPAVESVLFRARKALRGMLASEQGFEKSPQVLPEPRA